MGDNGSSVAMHNVTYWVVVAAAAVVAANAFAKCGVLTLEFHMQVITCTSFEPSEGLYLLR